MKYFTVLMSLYMLLLSCMPCNDSIDCNEDTGVSVVSKTADHNDHEDEENCTPFCVCACCAAPVFQAPVAFTIRKFCPRIQLNFYLEEAFYTTSQSRIWQPPRIA
ncbi:MAG: hypothetical protein EOO13_03675 [Chitinophagaceae bacterium]|nr:MAG: hypothetical protein EOO13_03675 [Chitinophagaceae bacterium]